MDAEVNDDVIDVDPTVARLQVKIADLLGKEAAMFMPSGTMTNQVAVRLHCRPGDEFLCEAGCHIYNYEQGAFAQLSGVAARTFQGTNSSIDLSQLLNQVHPDNEHATRTRLLCLENTHNKGGGVVLPYDSVAETCQWARESGLKTHLDGARLFNAVVASNISAKQWAQHFDTISICFSKGLGAPVGSALVGERIHDLPDAATQKNCLAVECGSPVFSRQLPYSPWKITPPPACRGSPKRSGNCKNHLTNRRTSTRRCQSGNQYHRVWNLARVRHRCRVL